MKIGLLFNAGFWGHFFGTKNVCQSCGCYGCYSLIRCPLWHLRRFLKHVVQRKSRHIKLYCPFCEKKS